MDVKKESNNDIVLEMDGDVPKNNGSHESQSSSKNVTDNQYDPWNYKIVLLLRKIGRKTTGYRWMHEQESKY